jgi:putative flippase GtrA
VLGAFALVGVLGVLVAFGVLGRSVRRGHLPGWDAEPVMTWLLGRSST